MKPVFETPAKTIDKSELSMPLGYANNADEAKSLQHDAARRSGARKALKFEHVEHPSGVKGFFPKYRGG